MRTHQLTERVLQDVGEELEFTNDLWANG